MTVLVRLLTVATVICALFAPERATALSEFVFASNFEAAPDCSSVGLSGCPGFVIETPSLELPPGGLVDACYYFRTPNSAVSAIGRFWSRFDPAVAHFIVWSTIDAGGLPVDAQPPGTFETNCGLVSGANTKNFRWVYAAHQPVEELRMPDEDGASQPIAFELAANTAGFLEIYYVNPGENTLTVPPVRFVANERKPGPYTSTASFLELYASISIPPMSSNATAGSACAMPAPTKAWWFSTQTHSHATGTQLSRSGSVTTPIVTSSDWESPAIETYGPPGFLGFTAPNQMLSYQCTYDNNTFSPIVFGDDYQHNEACMGITYFFPANQSKLCLNNAVVTP